MTSRKSIAAIAALCLTAALSACAGVSTSGPPTAAQIVRKWGPIIPGAHFHHVHMNVKNREAALAFYTAHFDAKRVKFDGAQDALWTQRSWILFDEVATPPSAQPGTAIDHFGWGAPDAQAEFQRQKALGANFQTEIRDISVSLGGKTGQFFFMYQRGPNGELIEINTDPDDNFGHIHMASADPVAAGYWYRNMFGAVDAPPYFDTMVIPTNVARTTRIYFDNINMIIIPARDPAALRSTRGSVTNHIGVSVPNLDAAMLAVRAHGIKVLEEPSVGGPGKLDRHAFIEGPDKMAIELLEDHTGHPPITD